MSIKDVHKDIASNILTPGGEVAGRIEGYAAGKIYGWIYDVRQPNDPLKLKLIIDGLPVEEFFSDIHRADIAILANNTGYNGFEINIDQYLQNDGMPTQVRIELIDESTYFIGPVTLVKVQSKSSVPTNLSDIINENSIESIISRKLDHIFSHITATFEDNRVRIEEVKYSLSKLEKYVISHKDTIGVDAINSSEYGLIYRDGLSGIGSFNNDCMDEDMKYKLMASRIMSNIINNQ